MAIPILGKLWETVAEKAGDIISEVVTDKDLKTELDHAFRTQLSKESHEYRQLEIQTEQEMYKAQQTTIQAELHQNDLYTKQTRPKIARQSWYITAFYAISCTLLPMVPESYELQPLVFQWEIFLVLASPALTYMGVRGFEKWKHGASTG